MPPTAGPAQPPRAARLIAVNLTACLLLLAQYLLGIVANLYVTLPAHHPGPAPATTSPESAPAWAG